MLIIIIIIIIVIIFQFSIISVPGQQLRDQLQTQHSTDTSNYIMDKHNLKSSFSYKNNINGMRRRGTPIGYWRESQREREH
jgi:uncharacterized membrane protein